MSVLSKAQQLVFWALTAVGGAAVLVIENFVFDLSGYLCFSGLVTWSVLAARHLR